MGSSSTDMSGDTLSFRGTLKGHSNWVTAIATSLENESMVVSASRDKTIIVWQLKRDDEENYGFAKRALKGHGHFVQDVVLSSDGNFALSASWDATLRLWDLNSGTTTRRFVGHTKDVLSVAFSADNRQIVSGSRDKTIKLWNTLGECKFTIQDDGHTEWVSCVRFSPAPSLTPATSTPSPSPLTAPCARPAARTVPPCSGICRRAATCTRSTPA